MLETIDRPMTSTPAQAYAMKAHGDQEAPEVIAGIFSLSGIEMHVLIDDGSTHSYVCIKHVFDKVTIVEQLSYDMHVTSRPGPGAGQEGQLLRAPTCPGPIYNNIILTLY